MYTEIGTHFAFVGSSFHFGNGAPVYAGISTTTNFGMLFFLESCSNTTSRTMPSPLLQIPAGCHKLTRTITFAPVSIITVRTNTIYSTPPYQFKKKRMYLDCDIQMKCVNVYVHTA